MNLNFRSASIVSQLAIIVLITVLIVFTALTFFVGHKVEESFMNTAEDSLEQQVQQLSANIDFYKDSLVLQTDLLADVFQRLFPNPLEIDTSSEQVIGGVAVPLLRHNGEIITNNFDKPDQFTKMTGATATVFMRVGDDFLRVSTSLRKADGSRAFGTMLGRTHPAYEALINGQAYRGAASLFGRNYMAKYTPFKDSSGKVIGILYVGFDFTDPLQKLKQNIAKLRLGETGYAYVVDLNEGKNYGRLILHPSHEGKTLTEVYPEKEKFLLDSLTKKQNGIIDLSLTTPEGEDASRMLAFSHSGAWNWAIVGGSKRDEFTKAVDLLLVEMMIISIICAALITGVLCLALRLKLKPIKTICGYMRAIGAGDLTKTIKTEEGPEGSHNEIHQLSQSAKVTITGLKKVTDELNQTMDSINGHLNTVSNGIDHLDEDINRQQQETEMVAAAISEMASTSEEVASHAASTAEQTMLANAETDSGDALVQEVVASIESISNEVSELTNMIEQVQQNSNSIGTVMDVIQNIAEQTNLLALNAAIEAARAGEAGRGFSVVADEVRNLAQQTASSTTEIREMIERLQSNTRNAVERMETSNNKVKISVEKTSQAGQVLKSITQSVTNISDASTQIASAAEEQTAVSEDISRNIESINTIAGETAESSGHMRQAVAQLDQAGHELQRVISLFKR